MASVHHSGGSGASARRPRGPRVECARRPALAEAAQPAQSSASWIATSVRSHDITVFLRQLIMLLEAGTPLLKSLKTLAVRSQSGGLRNLVSDIASHVENGNALWQAFERHSRYFDPVFVNLVKASEASGTLITVLRRLVEYREQREVMRKRVIGAMFYPVVLLIACLGVIVLIARVVIPGFMELFQRLDVELPAFTENFIAVIDFVGAWWWLGLLILAGLIVLYKLAVLNPLYRLYADRLKLRLPLIGSILRKSGVAEFTNSLALLLKSGMSMMATLDLVRHALRNQAFAHIVQQMRDSVEEGGGLEQPLRQNASVFPPVVADMLVTGEESGQLDDIARQIARTYEEEVNIEINTLGDALVPIIVIFIAVVVLILALALFRPLIDMVEQLSAGAGF
ncbi:MAG: type II secretion system F family protein [Candidatus Hydrogenedentota bacterium]